MPENTETLDPRASLIEDLISRQDDVLRQLEELDARLLATIESIRPSQKEGESDSADEEQMAPAEQTSARKAA